MKYVVIHEKLESVTREVAESSTEVIAVHESRHEAEADLAFIKKQIINKAADHIDAEIHSDSESLIISVLHDTFYMRETFRIAEINYVGTVQIVSNIIKNFENAG